jgi:hypothetical protein
VVTEQVQKTVPLQREEVRVEREPITDANVGDARAGQLLVGLISIAPERIGTSSAHSHASARSRHSSTQKPPSWSFVSANGPSVTTGS